AHADGEVVGASRGAHHVQPGSADQPPAALGALRADGLELRRSGAAEVPCRSGRGRFTRRFGGLLVGRDAAGAGGLVGEVVPALLVLLRPVCHVVPPVSWPRRAEASSTGPPSDRAPSCREAA